MIKLTEMSLSNLPWQKALVLFTVCYFSLCLTKLRLQLLLGLKRCGSTILSCLKSIIHCQTRRESASKLFKNMKNQSQNSFLSKKSRFNSKTELMEVSVIESLKACLNIKLSYSLKRSPFCTYFIERCSVKRILAINCKNYSQIIKLLNSRENTWSLLIPRVDIFFIIFFMRHFGVSF